MVASAIESRHAVAGVLLDVGCGRGELWPFVADQFSAYAGVDAVRYDEISTRFIGALRRLAKEVIPARTMYWLLELRHGYLPVPYRVVRPHSRVSNLNLLFLTELLRRVDASRTPGDVVECGVYWGGSAGVLAYHEVRSPFPRRVWLYDAFSVIPPRRIRTTIALGQSWDNMSRGKNKPGASWVAYASLPTGSS
jgi:hypothetical protein